MISDKYYFRKIDSNHNCYTFGSYVYFNKDELNVLSVLQKKKLVNTVPNDIVRQYFEKKWLGYCCYEKETPKMIAYCFIKNPVKRPETMTVVLSKYRNRGIARELRNYAIDDAIKNDLVKGQYIYSAVEKWNIPSLVSVLKSGYEIFRFELSCEEGGAADNQFIQLHKKIR